MDGDGTRLDQEVVHRHLARSRAQAHTLITSGRVRVNGAVVRRPAAQVTVQDRITADADRYVSRAAYKLVGALDALELEVAGRALDAGASTGGFTQVLLERGCTEVIAVDVGTEQLAAELRADPRVIAHEQTNLRSLGTQHVDDRPVDLVVADVSFISLTLLIEPLVSVVRPEGWLLLMVKPQFEVGRELLGKGGVVRDLRLHRQAVETVAAAASALGWYPRAVVRSALPGGDGNLEYFVHFTRGDPAALDLTAVIPLPARP